MDVSKIWRQKIHRLNCNQKLTKLRNSEFSFWNYDALLCTASIHAQFSVYGFATSTIHQSNDKGFEMTNWRFVYIASSLWRHFILKLNENEWFMLFVTALLFPFCQQWKGKTILACECDNHLCNQHSINTTDSTVVNIRCMNESFILSLNRTFGARYACVFKPHAMSR